MEKLNLEERKKHIKEVTPRQEAIKFLDEWFKENWKEVVNKYNNGQESFIIKACLNVLEVKKYIEDNLRIKVLVTHEIRFYLEENIYHRTVVTQVLFID